MNKAKIFDIQKSSFSDGPGIRTTIYFKGCNLRCKWCHNPESWMEQNQLLFFRDKCRHCGICKAVCPHGAIAEPSQCVLCGKCAMLCPHKARILFGEEKTVEELLAIVMQDAVFYADEGGVTCSGGECMLQIDFLASFLKACKEKGIHTAVDTACNVPQEYFDRIIPYTDLFLVDIKAASTDLHKEFTGVGNVRIMSNIRYLSERNCRIWIRIPVIKECNGNNLEMSKIADIVNSLNIEKVELLPYHTFGINKAYAMGLKPVKFEKIPQLELESFKKLFRKVD